MTTQQQARPAFYALAPGGWRDYVTLLHPPYTIWHLSYVAIGASLAPDLEASRLVWGLAAFFLAMGVGAHALDELNGRPLGTRIPAAALVSMAAASIFAAAVMGLVAALAWTLWLVPFVVFGVAISVAYTLELAGGRFHSDIWFALVWGAFPVLTAYVGTTGRIRVEAVLAALFAAILSSAQRRLSTDVRNIRRRASEVSGSVTFRDGRVVTIDRESLTETPEAALRTLSAAIFVLALALVVLALAH